MGCSLIGSGWVVTPLSTRFWELQQSAAQSPAEALRSGRTARSAPGRSPRGVAARPAWLGPV
ncbi:MAG: hypothetical protein DI630_31055 [Gordonia sp. (in: high G+C Gram-positive bacteria)]|nr:MAG: hypothetical protein DI630_31055 [Gordonia sp. (in: high G+C Gram-positive bacteria)]